MDPPDQPEYPKQELLPQDVAQGPNRKPLFIALAVVVVLALVAGGAYLLLRDDGEGSRTAYCDELRTLTKDGDLGAAAEGAGPELSGQLQELVDDAPDKVADDWQTLRKFAESSSGGTPDVASLGNLVEALQAISKDARNNCDPPIDLPSLPNL